MLGAGVGPGYRWSGCLKKGGAISFRDFWTQAFLNPIPGGSTFSTFQVTGDSSPGFYVSASSNLAGGLAEAWRVKADVNYEVTARNTDPVRNIYTPGSFNDRDSGVTLYKTARFPDAFTLADVDGGPDTPNNPTLLVNMDTGQATGLNACCRPTVGGNVWGYIASLSSVEIVSTRGGSYTAGGYVTLAELQSVINHRLTINVHGLKYLSNNGTGFVSPALTADAGYNTPAAFDYYGGNDTRLKMGSYVGIPSGVTAVSLGLTTAVGSVLLACLKTYGAHIVDNTAWDSFAVQTTADAKATIETWEVQQDIIRLFAAMQLIL